MLQLVQLPRKGECGLRGQCLRKPVCLEQGSLAFLMPGTCHQATRPHGVKARHLRSLGGKRETWSCIHYLFFRKTSCRKCPLTISPPGFTSLSMAMPGVSVQSLLSQACSAGRVAPLLRNLPLSHSDSAHSRLLAPFLCLEGKCTIWVHTLGIQLVTSKHCMPARMEENPQQLQPLLQDAQTWQMI